MTKDVNSINTYENLELESSAVEAPSVIFCRSPSVSPQGSPRSDDGEKFEENTIVNSSSSDNLSLLVEPAPETNMDFQSKDQYNVSLEERNASLEDLNISLTGNSLSGTAASGPPDDESHRSSNESFASISLSKEVIDSATGESDSTTRESFSSSNGARGSLSSSNESRISRQSSRKSSLSSNDSAAQLRHSYPGTTVGSFDDKGVSSQLHGWVKRMSGGSDDALHVPKKAVVDLKQRSKSAEDEKSLQTDLMPDFIRAHSDTVLISRSQREMRFGMKHFVDELMNPQRKENYHEIRSAPINSTMDPLRRKSELVISSGERSHRDRSRSAERKKYEVSPAPKLFSSGSSLRGKRKGKPVMVPHMAHVEIPSPMLHSVSLLSPKRNAELRRTRSERLRQERSPKGSRSEASRSEPGYRRSKSENDSVSVDMFSNAGLLPRRSKSSSYIENYRRIGAEMPHDLSLSRSFEERMREARGGRQESYPLVMQKTRSLPSSPGNRSEMNQFKAAHAKLKALNITQQRATYMTVLDRQNAAIQRAARLRSEPTPVNVCVLGHPTSGIYAVIESFTARKSAKRFSQQSDAFVHPDHYSEVPLTCQDVPFSLDISSFVEPLSPAASSKRSNFQTKKFKKADVFMICFCGKSHLVRSSFRNMENSWMPSIIKYGHPKVPVVIVETACKRQCDRASVSLSGQDDVTMSDIRNHVLSRPSYHRSLSEPIFQEDDRSIWSTHIGEMKFLEVTCEDLVDRFSVHNSTASSPGPSSVPTHSTAPRKLSLKKRRRKTVAETLLATDDAPLYQGKTDSGANGVNAAFCEACKVGLSFQRIRKTISKKKLPRNKSTRCLLM